MMLKNLIVIAAIMLLGFVPSQIGMWILEHEGWAGQGIRSPRRRPGRSEFKIPHCRRRRVALDSCSIQHLAPMVQHPRRDVRDDKVGCR